MKDSDLELRKITAQKILLQRTKAKLSQEDLSFMIGLTRVSVANLESGAQGLTVKMLLRLSAALNCLPSDLLPTAKEYAPQVKKLSKILEDKTNRKIQKLQEQIDRLKSKKIIITD